MKKGSDLFSWGCSGGDSFLGFGWWQGTSHSSSRRCVSVQTSMPLPPARVCFCCVCSMICIPGRSQHWEKGRSLVGFCSLSIVCTVECGVSESGCVHMDLIFRPAEDQPTGFQYLKSTFLQVIRVNYRE